MKIQTMSIVTGTMACNARCPFCVARMTPKAGLKVKPAEINWPNFKKACQFAKDSGVSTVLLTGKGEPTLFPHQISEYLEALDEYQFPFIELQTNGIWLERDDGEYHVDEMVDQWYEYGLNTIAISVVHYDEEMNRAVYRPMDKKYYNLKSLIKKLHNYKFSVRLACTMMKGFVSTPQDVADMIEYSYINDVEQLTVRPVAKPDAPDDKEAEEYVRERLLSPEEIGNIKHYLDKYGTRVLELPHGAVVYDVRGQNVCLSNCLTRNPDPEKIRQIIFFPDGSVRYDWQYRGARLL